MYKKITIIILTLALLNLTGISNALANSSSEKDELKTTKIKQEIQRLGSGDSARVKIKLKDNSKLEGYIGEIKAESFTVKDSKTGQSSEVGYHQVKKIFGHNLSTGTKIAIGVGIAAVVFVIAVVVAGRPCKNALCK